MGIEKIAKTAIGTVVGAGVVAGLYFGLIKPLVDQSKWENAYHRALIQYADTNHDGIVTSAEEDAFSIDLLKDKGVTLMPRRMPVYKSGKEVPMSTVTEWIENYKPSE